MTRPYTTKIVRHAFYPYLVMDGDRVVAYFSTLRQARAETEMLNRAIVAEMQRSA